MPKFIRCALTQQPIPVYGDGSQTRSLCYIDDLVQGLIAAMESPAASGEVINLGNPEEHSVLEYAQIIRKLTGSHAPIAFVAPLTDNEPTRRRPDISKAGRLLGWAPRVGLEEGLRRTIDYVRRSLSSEKAEVGSGV